MTTAKPCINKYRYGLLKKSVAAWRKSKHEFAWPDDSVPYEGWMVEFRKIWISAWDDEGRKSDAGEFMLRQAAWIMGANAVRITQGDK